MTIHIVANCYVDGSDVESDCSGTVGYDVRGLKTSVVKGNKADYIYMGASGCGAARWHRPL